MKKYLTILIATLVVLCFAQIGINMVVVATMTSHEPVRVVHYVHDGTEDRPAETIPFGDAPTHVVTPTTPGFPSYKGPNTP